MLQSNVSELTNHGNPGPHMTAEPHMAEWPEDLRRALALVEAQKLELQAGLTARDQIRAQLEEELRDSQLLHNISAMLIDEHNINNLYQKLVDVATTIMRAEIGGMQRYDAERNALQLIAHRGLSDEAIAFWHWVSPGQPTTCGLALEKSERVIVKDFQTCPFIAGTANGAAFHKAGLRSAQSTPLLTRNGRLVGMITTHYTHSFEPNERDLRLLDIVARQAADLIERNMAMDALQRQAADLVKADRYKNEFLATLAHELRNPLAPLRNGLAFLKNGTVEKRQRVLEMMDRQVGQMAHLIDDLLDVSRISRGTIIPSLSRVTLGSLIDGAVETSRPFIDAADHRFTVTMPGNDVWLNVDSIRIIQIIGNLLNNSAKYTPLGGEIKLVAEVIDTQVVIRISDTGIGIPAEMLPKIFDLFTQVDGAAEGSKGGLGVGLALSRKLAELHHGCIEVESPGKGGGSVFTLRLPLDATTAVVSATSVELESHIATGSSARILIVDDNVDAAEILAIVLESQGHLTSVVFDSRDATAAAFDFKPDIAILDIGMPYLSGLDVARQFRAAPNLKHVCLIALSGWGTDEDVKKSSDAGMDCHFTKPVMVDEVTDFISRAIRRRDGGHLPGTTSSSCMT